MPAFTQIKQDGAEQSVIWATGSGSGLSNGDTITLSGLTNLGNPFGGGNLADRIKAVYDTTTTYYVINFLATGGQDEWKLSASSGGAEVDPSTISGGTPGAVCQNSSGVSYTVVGGGGGGGGSGAGKHTVKGTGKITVKLNGKFTVK